MVTRMAVHKPKLGNIPELDVFSYLLGNKVAVIIDDRLFFRMLMIQLSGGVISKHEIFVDECHL